MKFNLSELAVHERAVTLFLIIAIAIAGTFAFFRLGRAEDPTFTIKVLTVTTAWPGATAQEMQDLVAEPLEKRLQELRDAAAAGKVTAARELHSLLKRVLARYEAMLRWSREAAASAGPASPAGKLAAAVQPKIIALRADLNWCEQLLV